MAQTIEVEINDTGEIHPVDASLKLRPGKAVLSWPVDEQHYPALMSEKALEDWLGPEEDAAWAYLQREK